ncbi:cyclopropane-fatty-acyl-phospholipid synthase family protein [Nitrosomonadaceae bacterium]|nr:cyclopropane-fatty-acyl-phospholipid synthase family protein [Nitrosomonadaceae bacterium]
MNSTSQLAFDLTEQGMIPDVVLRRGIQLLLKQRLKEIDSKDVEIMAEMQSDFIKIMKESAIALVPEKANEQHYEVPADFYTRALGARKKYSSAYWPEGVTTLDEAEKAGLAKTCEHARLEDGQQILELGCGWGSLTLWMAEHYPNAHITAVSNSHSQRKHIESHAKKNGIKNVNIITCDMNDLDIEIIKFDRVVSVEMFEHMRNWEKIYENVSAWLKPEGYFFKHIFVHKTAAYEFVDNGPSDWMGRYFFSGGIMPSDDLPLAFQKDLIFIQRWRWDGRHYEKTANAWLENMDNNKQALLPLFKKVYSNNDMHKWWSRWRMFFMACAELFGYNNGQEWWVSHYLFQKPKVN